MESVSEFILYSDVGYVTQSFLAVIFGIVLPKKHDNHVLVDERNCNKIIYCEFLPKCKHILGSN